MQHGWSLLVTPSASWMCALSCKQQQRQWGLSGPSNAEQGTLTLYVGGEERDVHTTRSLLACLTDCIHHLGGHGTGYSAKLLINQLLFTQAVVFAEVLTLAIRLGLHPHNFATLLQDSPAASAFARDYLPRLIAGDQLPEFGLHRVVEELDSLVRAAAASGAPWIVSKAVCDLHRDALSHYGTVNGELLGAPTSHICPLSTE